MAKWAIVSPRAPNGVTFLLNIFLELDILIYRILHPGDGPYSRTWDKQGWKFVVQEGEFNALKTQLPSLREKTVYSFEKGVEVLWDHAQDLVHYADFNLLVLTRDPRDSLF